MDYKFVLTPFFISVEIRFGLTIKQASPSGLVV